MKTILSNFLDSIFLNEFFIPASGNLFLNAFRLVERDFLASGNTFFVCCLDISASDGFSRLVET